MTRHMTPLLHSQFVHYRYVSIRNTNASLLGI